MKDYIKDLAERVIATFAEGFLGAITANAVTLGDIDWVFCLSAGGFASLIAVLKCLTALKVGDKNTASLVKK